MSNYEEAKRNAAKRFLTFDTQKIIRRLSLNADSLFLYVDFAGKPYRIDRKSGICTYEEKENVFREADHNAAMSIYDILCHTGEPIHMSGQLVPFETLSTIQNAYSYAGNGMFREFERFFDEHTAALAAACEALHGTKTGKGDVSYQIPVFDKIDLLISFWNSDEDFPASLKIYCDRYLTKYMYYETIWYMASYILERLQQEIHSNQIH